MTATPAATPGRDQGIRGNYVGNDEVNRDSKMGKDEKRVDSRGKDGRQQ